MAPASDRPDRAMEVAGGPVAPLRSPAGRSGPLVGDAGGGSRGDQRRLLALQQAAGNGVVAGLFGRVGAAVPVQRVGPTGAGGPAAVTFRGRRLTEDPAQLRAMLEDVVAAGGQDAAETFAYAFLRMSPEEKLPLQLSTGLELEQIARIQRAFEPVLDAVKAEQRAFLDSFGPLVVTTTQDVLSKSKELLHQEEMKYTDTYPAQEKKPDLDGLRAAARALAAKRAAANAAGVAAQTANRNMVDQNRPKAEFGSPFPAPQSPYFPNPELRAKAGAASDTWWHLEQEYGTLRAEKERLFPVLAMFAANEDGGAADRLTDLPTSGLFADYRLKDKLWSECRTRLMNVEEAQSQLDVAKAWQLPRMVDTTLTKLAAPAYRQRWANDNAAKLAAAQADRQKMIAVVTLAVVVVTTAMTAGAALAVEGTAAAATFSALAATGSALSAGMSIATAFSDIRDYQFKKAAAASDIDAAKSISAGEPSLLWVAVAVVAALVDVGAARAAFKTASTAIKSVQAGEEVLGSLKAIEGASKTAADEIIPRVLDEAEASGALQKAIVAAGKQFEEAALGRMKELVEQGLGRTWAEEFEFLKARKRVLPFTKEGLEGVLGPKTAAKVMGEGDFEKTIGMYHLDSGKAFVRPAAEGDLASSMVHEMTHAVQGPQRTEFAPFIREFEAYAAQREMMRRLNQLYGWKPRSNAWLLEANDWQVAKHIRLEYGFRVPPWVLEEPLAPTQLDKTFRALTARLKRFSTPP